MKKGADWISWSVQFITGAVVGTCLTLGSSAKGILGCALIIGAVASHFGDRLWLHDTSRTIPTIPPRQSPTSRWASLIVAITGAMLLACELHSSR